MVRMNFEEKQKCQFDNCYHPNSKHNNGLCWEITQPEERGFEIYCPCTLQGEKHRLYSDVGIMIVGQQDYMITRTCRRCNEDVVLNLDENFCKNCKSTMATVK